MRNYFFVLLMLVGTTLPALSASDKAGWALSNFHHEMVECLVFYSISGEALRRGRAKDGATQTQKVNDVLLKRIFAVGSALGMKQEAMHARMKLSTADQMKAIGNNYVNYSILLERYLDLCKAVVETPDVRLQYWQDKY